MKTMNLRHRPPRTLGSTTTGVHDSGVVAPDAVERILEQRVYNNSTESSEETNLLDEESTSLPMHDYGVFAPLKTFAPTQPSELDGRNPVCIVLPCLTLFGREDNLGFTELAAVAILAMLVLLCACRRLVRCCCCSCFCGASGRDVRGEYQAVGHLLDSTFDEDVSEEGLEDFYETDDELGDDDWKPTIELSELESEDDAGLTLEEMNG